MSLDSPAFPAVDELISHALAENTEAISRRKSAKDSGRDRAKQLAKRMPRSDFGDYSFSTTPGVVEPVSDWAFEEKLASHREWLESQGATTGKKANWANVSLEDTELIGISLRFADLHAANLKGADLLLADLRDTCLVRANLQEACLVGANLEGANLEGASLATSMGLVARQLAGTNLRDAALPAEIGEFGALAEFDHCAARRNFSWR